MMFFFFPSFCCHFHHLTLFSLYLIILIISLLTALHFKEVEKSFLLSIKKMEEQAKEELEILEDQYPNQYEFLKQELRSLISQLHYNNHNDSQNNHFNTPHNVYFDTEESTSLEHTDVEKCGIKVELGERKEKKDGERCDLESPKSVVMTHSPNTSSRKNKRKDRVDLVLDRAKNCLKKIQLFKISLFSST